MINDNYESMKSYKIKIIICQQSTIAMLIRN